MKKIGEYTCRGSVQGNNALNTALPTEKISLFDGSYKTAYKVIEFKVLSGSFYNSGDDETYNFSSDENPFEDFVTYFEFKEEIEQVATISAQDPQVGHIIAEAMDIV